MTAISSLNKPITLSFRPPAAKKSLLAVGSVPRADLLPPSVVAARRMRNLARTVGIALVTTLVVMLLGFVASLVFAASAAATLADESAKTEQLLQSQADYTEVSSALSSIDVLTSARAAVGAMDVDWADYLGDLEASLPAGTTLKGVSITAATPTAAVVQPVTPIALPRVATLLLTVSSSDIGVLQQWLATLPELKGYSDAVFLAANEVDGLYEAQIELGVNEGIWSGIYSTDDTPAADTFEETEQ